MEKNLACSREMWGGLEESDARSKKSEEGIKESRQWRLQQRNVQIIERRTGNKGNSKSWLRVSAVAGVAILILIMLLFRQQAPQSLLNRAQNPQ
jgi:hypothetical protein